ncbi:uncharacterized protein LOC123559536 [Mercenaria mercenaria]|uniref:uncharacterized protein LOC123559536 n=1 Tax=Mercenaria mercenaria TaxID=6596 RepID=UPI00234E8973|nr:uncharacterized protein LOC123559536 [Mercenaria mercenaria]
METTDTEGIVHELEVTNGKISDIDPIASGPELNCTAEHSSSNSDESENNLDRNGSTGKVDKLEKYLEDIYEKYCKFSTDEAEIEFIRKGVESLTLEYLQKTYRHSPCEDISCKINHFSEIELVKVGSFYEGTRNGYPNEFDFMAVLGTVDEVPDIDSDSHLRTGTCMQFDIYQSGEFPDASIEYCFTSGSRAHGIAERLEYLYKKGSEEITIDVDVVVALRCYNTEKYYTGNGIFNQEFYKEILKTKGFLFIYTGSSVSSNDKSSNVSVIPADHVSCHGPWDKSITETEKRFVRDVLTKQQKKVYQLLKYIINGPFGEDLFKHFDDVQHFQSPLSPLLGTGFCISSYAIKVAVIHHHYRCDNSLDKMGDCVLQLLKYFLLAYGQGEKVIYMHSLLYLNQIGSCMGRGNYEFLGNFYWCLRAFICRLASLRTADGLEKCAHDLENSFMEMALRLDIFPDILQYLSSCRPKFGRLVEKLKHYNEKRNVVPDCPWCDYPIFIMAHKRKV